MSDFRRQKWHVPGESNSIAKQMMSPRVTLIAAIDTEESIFESLLHMNTNTTTMGIFMKALVLKLDS